MRTLADCQDQRYGLDAVLNRDATSGARWLRRTAARGGRPSEGRRAWGAALLVALVVCLYAASALGGGEGFTPPGPATARAEETAPLPGSELPAGTTVLADDLDVELAGTYSEQLVEPGGDIEEVSYEYDMATEWGEVGRTGSGGLAFENETIRLHGSGNEIHTFEDNKIKGETVTCGYTTKAEVASGGGFRLHLVSGEVLDVDTFIPLSGQYVKKTGGEQCLGEGVGTDGTPTDQGFVAATEPVREVNLEGCKRPIVLPIDYSEEPNGDNVDIHATLTITCMALLGPPQEVSPPAKSVEKIEPSTPIEPPVSPPHTPTEPKPIVEEIGEPIFGGGGGTGGGGKGGKGRTPPKLKTGLRARCPASTTGCTVTGILLASVPGAPSAHKGSAAHAKQRQVAIGSTTFKLAAGTSSPVTIALSRSGLALLSTRHHLPVSITVSIAAPGVASVKHVRALTLRLPHTH